MKHNLACKSAIRKLWPELQYRSIHINDTHEETVDLAKYFLNHSLEKPCDQGLRSLANPDTQSIAFIRQLSNSSVIQPDFKNPSIMPWLSLSHSPK